ncbi:hypothetical protein TEA_009514 [Camellia sinensis var. sinensis]|uniref:Uncharacterized protein n=1 Tax=Camellia sinensis var. sinensis TaxID=542762 RepID=A0A4S4D8M6_CAMSN|nr:hypothetical protein TEA_009514 [Camellia sinensis var. sinensis]
MNNSTLSTKQVIGDDDLLKQILIHLKKTGMTLPIQINLQERVFSHLQSSIPSPMDSPKIRFLSLPPQTLLFQIQFHNPNPQKWHQKEEFEISEIAQFRQRPLRVWMGSGERFADIHTIVFENGVFLNGKIHWPSQNSETSIYYDLNREKLLSMPMSCHFHIGKILNFGEFGGHLHYIRDYGQWCPQFDVYEMDSDYSKWFVKCIVDLYLGVSAFSEMFCMYPDRFTPDYVVDVLCLVGGEVERDSCLILYIPGKVISDKFKDRSFRKVAGAVYRYVTDRSS